MVYREIGENGASTSLRDVKPGHRRLDLASLTRGGLTSHPDGFSTYRFPKIVEHARRVSTRRVLTEVLTHLEHLPNRSGAINVSALARQMAYHRRTVQRALDFGVKQGVLEPVTPPDSPPHAYAPQPGTPRAYRSKWKLSTSLRAPSPHPYNVQPYLPYGKTRTRESRDLKAAAMTKIRHLLEAKKLPHLVAAYGKYVWSQGSTVEGISTLVKHSDRVIVPRTYHVSKHDSFGLTMHLIKEHIVPLDQTEHALRQLHGTEDLPEISEQRKKHPLANMNNFVSNIVNVNDNTKSMNEGLVRSFRRKIPQKKKKEFARRKNRYLQNGRPVPSNSKGQSVVFDGPGRGKTGPGRRKESSARSPLRGEGPDGPRRQGRSPRMVTRWDRAKERARRRRTAHQPRATVPPPAPAG